MDNVTMAAALKDIGNMEHRIEEHRDREPPHERKGGQPREILIKLEVEDQDRATVDLACLDEPRSDADGPTHPTISNDAVLLDDSLVAKIPGGAEESEISLEVGKYIDVSEQVNRRKRSRPRKIPQEPADTEGFLPEQALGEMVESTDSQAAKLSGGAEELEINSEVGTCIDILERAEPVTKKKLGRPRKKPVTQEPADTESILPKPVKHREPRERSVITHPVYMRMITEVMEKFDEGASRFMIRDAIVSKYDFSKEVTPGQITFHLNRTLTKMVDMGYLYHPPKHSHSFKRGRNFGKLGPGWKVVKMHDHPNKSSRKKKPKKKPYSKTSQKMKSKTKLDLKVKIRNQAREKESEKVGRNPVYADASSSEERSSGMSTETHLDPANTDASCSSEEGGSSVPTYTHSNPAGTICSSEEGSSVVSTQTHLKPADGDASCSSEDKSSTQYATHPPFKHMITEVMREFRKGATKPQIEKALIGTYAVKKRALVQCLKRTLLEMLETCHLYREPNHPMIYKRGCQFGKRPKKKKVNVNGPKYKFIERPKRKTCQVEGTHL